MPPKKPTKKRNSFNAPHPNSILAQTADDPEARRRYEDWHAEIMGDEQAMRRWARSDFQSAPGNEVKSVRIRRQRKAKGDDDATT